MIIQKSQLPPPTVKMGVEHSSPVRSLMYCRKSVGSGMETSGTPALTGYSCKYFLSRTTRSSLLLRNGEKKTNT